MTFNILVTGAAGYIGGSVAAHFRNRLSSSIEVGKLVVSVRSEEQATALSKANLSAFVVDLSDDKAVTDLVLREKINVAIHCASGLDTAIAVNLIKALGQYRSSSGTPAHFIHTSGGSAFAEKAGWNFGPVRDTDSVYEFEKELSSHPLRQTDVAVTDTARALGVASYIIVPPLVYGRGLGEWNKLSVCIPKYIRASLKERTVYRFSEDTRMPAVHLMDLLTYYEKIVVAIADGQDIPSGKAGYYFATAHELNWWETLDHLAKALKQRQLVNDAEVHHWPSDQSAAEALEIPVDFVHSIWNSVTPMIAQNRFKIDWRPAQSTEALLLESLGDEVDAVLELDTVRSSVFDKLHS